MAVKKFILSNILYSTHPYTDWSYYTLSIPKKMKDDSNINNIIELFPIEIYSSETVYITSNSLLDYTTLEYIDYDKCLLNSEIGLRIANLIPGQMLFIETKNYFDIIAVGKYYIDDTLQSRGALFSNFPSNEANIGLIMKGISYEILAAIDYPKIIVIGFDLVESEEDIENSPCTRSTTITYKFI